jgi:CheY-like chemotaxis protein
VVTAADGIEALTEYLKNPQSIKMVLTDVVMPYMDGVDLARALKKIDRNLIIVVAGAYGNDGGEAEMKALGPEAFLRKPFTADQLLRTIHAALHSAERSI